MTTEEIRKVVCEYLEAHEEPSILGFVQKNLDFVAQNTPSSAKMEKFWPNIIRCEAYKLNKSLAKSRTHWKRLFETGPTPNNGDTASRNIAVTSTPINDQVTHTLTRNNNDNNSHTPSSTKSTTSSLGKRLRSSSSKYDSYELTLDMKQQYKQTFESLDDNEKWVLEDGTIVENEMYKYGAKCTHEHPVHSFILDTSDKQWESVFTNSQLQEIKTTGKKALCDYNESCKNMFAAFEKVIMDTENSNSAMGEGETNSPFLNSVLKEEHLIDALWEKLEEFGLINPRKKGYDLHWIQKTLEEIFDLYKYRVLNWVKDHGSEMDFVVRVWAIIDKVFDDLKMETRRDNVSVATTFIDNKERAVNGTSSIETKIPSIRPDLVLYKDGVEYGVAECGKGGDEKIGKKEIVETNLHCPKIMKSMLLHILSKCGNDKDVARALRIVGFSHFDLRMAVLVMDNPGGYVCRIRATQQYEISTDPFKMLAGLLPILKLTLKSKISVQSSTEIVNDYFKRPVVDPDVECEMIKNATCILLPPLQKSPNKKPKSG